MSFRNPNSAAHKYARTLPLRKVVKFWVEYLPEQMEKACANGGKVGVYDLFLIWHEEYECGHTDTCRGFVKSRRCWQCKLLEKIRQALKK